MKERPILYSGSMVRAILDDRKTQTRRIMKPQPTIDRRGLVSHHSLGGSFAEHVFGSCFVSLTPKPYAAVGDTLWVRETWAAPHACDHLKPSEVPQGTGLHFAASEERGGLLWRPSIFMPRWASRLTLDVTAVRVERLQAISEDDARAEGVEPYTPPHGSISPDQRVPGVGFDDARLGDQPHRLPFAHLWDDINGDRASWDSNPWVWVVEFARAEVRK